MGRAKNGVFGWRNHSMFGLVVAGLLLSSTAVARDGTDAEYLWIQDPWTGESVLTAVRAPDYSLWDPTQISDYQAARNADYPPPLAILTIDALDIQVPVWNGAEEHVLDRGAGRIKGMAKPGEEGNFGISAHRDSFFRALKDIEQGTEIVVQTTHGVDRYAVSEIEIVPKHDSSVLELTDDKRLTLVTCYPFYHVGHAPERYIITALPLLAKAPDGQ
ncbi:MAG: class D sortase [Xanthomonadales bacterium]|nr:class D sortase [Gammaproteobacteria bacterium]MBT8055509.1 class D sortase [Gammaproteobacteria bacterium]NNL03673.1 class D sortase [Xanthomonadales bacterium]